MKAWKKPTNELIEKALGVLEKETDRQYFFSRLKNPLWIQPLVKRGYFQSPPKVRHLPSGAIQMPAWPELQYLKNVSGNVPDEVVNLILGIPKVDNPRIYSEILEIALRLPGTQSGQLKSKVLESVGMEYESFAYRYTDLLIYWVAEDQTSAALELAKVLVQFVSDPQSEIKQERRRKNRTDPGTLWETSLEPSPRFETWEYSEIMCKGVRLLAEREPYQVARILIDATANMIRLRTHPGNLNQEADSSGTWCEGLDGSDNSYEDSKKTLVHTLTFACAQVYEKSPDLVRALDAILRNQQWWIFKRLRQYLYAQYPDERTEPWIRELILVHEGYKRWNYHYEFGQMIQNACEHFGETLLTKAERAQIFDDILGGPSRKDFRKWLKEWMGKEFTKERFQQRQRDFHWKQFRPFASVLFGEYASYFHELEGAGEFPISDGDYQSKINVGYVSNRSSRFLEDLVDLTDEALLVYINEWDKEDFLYEDDGFIEIAIGGLAGAFQTIFEESIIPDASRLRFWMENLERIGNPRYVQVMINVMREQITAKNFDNLNDWLRFSEWVLSQTDCEAEVGNEQKGASQESPKWYDSRWAVSDFIEACLEENMEIPVSVWGQLAKLLDMLCTQFDWHLDRDSDRNDSIDEALNNLRSHALQNLIKFGFWLQKHDLGAEVSEVTTILEKRFTPQTERPLTLPEYAILGRIYNQIYELGEAWATEHKSDFFPQGDLISWLAAFGSFVRYNPPLKRTFEIFWDDFDFSLQHLADFKEPDRSEQKQKDSFGWSLHQNSPEVKLIESLGRHLFCYYLWGLYPLRGEESLLERYYQGTDKNRKRWASLFNYVGSILRNTSKILDKGMKERIVAFFDWRLETKEPTELRQFAFWLEAKCLEAEWRLDAFSKILAACKPKDVSIHIRLRAFGEMLPDCTPQVVECFAKLTDGIGDNNIYIPTEEAKTLLNAGLKSNDESVCRNAVRARENLLREGRIDLLDIDG